MWLKPQGYAEIVTPVDDVVHLDRIRSEHISVGIAKFDSCTCFHCNSIFHVSAGMRPEDIGGMCPVCWHPICPRCLDKPCMPWEAQMEALERSVERRRLVEEYF